MNKIESARKGRHTREAGEVFWGALGEAERESKRKKRASDSQRMRLIKREYRRRRKVD